MIFRRREPRPEPDFGPEMEPFRDGLAVLLRDGEPVGHVATTLGHFRTPFAPRTPKPWVWLVVRWSDGTKEIAQEDYPPWTYVSEMRAGHIEWVGSADRRRDGWYEIAWVPREQAAQERERLGIGLADF
jgi:hypothetical protein